MAEFFQMGGYAAYVWPCFALSAAILIYNAIQPVLRHKQVKREIRGSLKRDQAKRVS